MLDPVLFLFSKHVKYGLLFAECGSELANRQGFLMCSVVTLYKKQGAQKWLRLSNDQATSYFLETWRVTHPNLSDSSRWSTSLSLSDFT